MASVKRLILAGILLSTPLLPGADKDEPKWIRVSSPHFTVLTDAGDTLGSQAALRLEQMRTEFGQLLLKSKLNLSEPLDVIAVKTDEEYIRLAPVKDGRPVAKSGFFLAGDDRNYIVLNLADEKSWQTILREFAYLFLKYNYPPAQPWFDEGLAEYLSSLQLEDKQAQIGADPGSLIALLNAQPWLSPEQLFSASFDPNKPDDPGKAMFRAQAWIVMHYLLTNNKLPETGSYFGLALNQHLPVGQAIQKAYGVSAEQFQQQVKDYFHSLTQPSSAQKSGTSLPPGAYQFTPVSPLEAGSSYRPVPGPEARALLAEMMVRMPEHRDAARQDLEGLVADPLTETSIAHRALGWVDIEKGQAEDAVDELQKALELTPQDPWAHYYFARLKYRSALATGSQFPGLANMLVNLRIVLDWDPDFAEAYNMLAMGRVEGGGINSAVEAIGHTVQLSPRNESYLLDMALVDMAAKKWDVVSVLLDRLKVSKDPEIAEAAKYYLEELPATQKYGLVPKRAVMKSAVGGAVLPTPKPQEEARTESSDEVPREKPPDRRKTQFSRGKLLRVDCSHAPAAVLTLAAGPKTMRLITEDYHSLLLIGADEFSCDWKDISVSANYKAGGQTDGDLVSLEIRK